MLRDNETQGSYVNFVAKSAKLHWIVNFDAAVDFVIVAGVTSHNDVYYEVEGDDTLVKV